MYKSSIKYIIVVKGWTIIKSVAQQFVRGSLFHVFLVGSFEYVPHWVIEKGKKKNQSKITASGEMWFESLRNEYIFFSNYEKSFKKKSNYIDHLQYLLPSMFPLVPTYGS